MGKLGRPTPLAEAEDVAMLMKEQIERLPGMRQVLVAGSVRRRKTVVSDVDLVVESEEADLTVHGTELGLRWTPKGGYAEINGVRVEVYLAPPKCVGATLLYCTGPGELNVYMRRRAQRYDWKLSQYGLLFLSGVPVVEPTGNAEHDERVLFDVLNVPWMDPEERSQWQEFVRT